MKPTKRAGAKTSAARISSFCALLLSVRIITKAVWGSNDHCAAQPFLDDEDANQIANSAYPSFCFTEKGSLHSIALDMFRHSSPPGSRSFRKLRHVLHRNPSFHINFPRKIFKSNQESLTSMFTSNGLMQETTDIPTESNCSDITLVETLLHSHCPIQNPNFVDAGRIIIQTEQTLKSRLGDCHASLNCIIVEFSDYNFRLLQEKGWGDSTILLPTMHQHPSRLVLIPPPQDKEGTLRLIPFVNRSIDVSFFGLITPRRKRLQEEKRKFLEQNPNRTVTLKQVGSLKTQVMSKAYGDSKVCLVTHSYRQTSGGEYHRLSEFAPFGCIPIMEKFADTIGIDRYTKCGRVLFADFGNLFSHVEDVLRSIDAGVYEGPEEFAHVKWWNKGVQWDSLLSDIFLFDSQEGARAS
ncbi:unnamed protein product [Cylindrotheca closterium]|uniref:Uncharacterized protein n=1 Tax=Cylindrotheca closterium TaxID=2856 RepID=A0AAD2JM86_9STRA|nr:unnamed protein product [Cylindrotheca closterium]CAJ1964040.1 unnamed protein product [Cylindrotheca closterium]